MKEFKTIDLWISILLIIGFFIYSLIQRDYTFLIGYCVVGGWQIISMIVHAARQWFTDTHGTRYTYHWIVAIICVATVIGLIFPSMLMLVLYPMIFAAPFMAVLYTCLCYRELYVKMKRPLADLK